VNRRSTKKRPPPRTHAPLLAVIERLESRAMLAGVGPESWSAPGLAPAPLGTGCFLPAASFSRVRAPRRAHQAPPRLLPQPQALAARRPVVICGIPSALDLGLEARRPAPPVA